MESESSKVGNLHIPAGLWRAMKIAPFVELVVPPQVRANFLIENYSDLKQDSERFKKLFLRAKSRINSEVISNWEVLLEQRDWGSLALSLIKNYYDPSYKLHQTRRDRTKILNIKSDRLTDIKMRNFAEQIIDFTNDSF